MRSAHATGIFPRGSAGCGTRVQSRVFFASNSPAILPDMPETLPHRLQTAINTLLAPLGLYLLRRERAFDMGGALARAAARGVRPSTVIDIGASDGIWSL